MEWAYDSQIRREDGAIRQNGARQRRSAISSDHPPQGTTVELTIDQYLQHVVDRELRAGIDDIAPKTAPPS